MLDIFTAHAVAKIKWVNRLISEGEKHRWSKLFWKMVNLEKTLFKCKIPISYKNRCNTIFHQQIIESWFKIKCKFPLNMEEIGNEFIFEFGDQKQFLCLFKQRLKDNYVQEWNSRTNETSKHQSSIVSTKAFLKWKNTYQ